MYFAYSNGFGTIRIAGETFGRFPIQGGVRQGCTGAAVLFGFALDTVLRWMTSCLSPLSRIVAYVDDLAFVFRDMVREFPVLHACFADLAIAAGLVLRIDKCYILIFDSTRRRVFRFFS